MRNLLWRHVFAPSIRGAPFGIAFVAGGWVGEHPLGVIWWLVLLATAVATTLVERAVQEWLPEKPA